MADQQKQKVIVTGGTRGIGFAIAEKLLCAGYGVILTGKSQDSIDQVIDSFDEEADGIPRNGFVLDLSSTESIEAFVAKIQLGGPDFVSGLVNNAAICETQSVNTTSGDKRFMDVWRRVIDVNLTGTALLTQQLLSCSALRRDGRIVNIASQLGKVGRAGYSAYCASKFGLIGLTEVWSRELAPLGMTVNAVCPGWIETDMTKQDLVRIAAEMGRKKNLRDFRREIESHLDQRRFNTPEEVANIVAFLLSPEASGITGQCIPMAGPSA